MGEHLCQVYDDDRQRYQAVVGLVRSGLAVGQIVAGLAAAPYDFAFAVNEVASNAFEHGRPPVGVRLHHGPDGWLCIVSDCGPGLPDPCAGLVAPSPGDPRGHGLWLARQLSDDLSIAPGPFGSGTTVRLEHWT